MKKLKKTSIFILSIIFFFLFIGQVIAVEKNSFLSWKYPFQDPAVTQIRLHYGDTSGNYTYPTTDIPPWNQDCFPDGVTHESNEYCYKATFNVPDNALTTYYLALTAVADNRIESAYSNEVILTYDFLKPPSLNDLTASYDTVTEIITFRWTYDPAWLDRIEKWTLYESDVKSGPYVKLIDIPYSPSNPSPYIADIQLTVPQGQRVTKYYVLVAFRSDKNNNAFSANSNEIEITINKMPPSAPFEFKIKVKD